MALPQSELDERRKWITGTDVPALLGVNPRHNAADVYMEKVHGVQQRETEATDLGERFEPVALDMAHELLAPDIEPQRNVHRTNQQHPRLRVQTDEILPGNIPLEAKTTGQRGPVYGEWGEPGDPDPVPIWINAQLQAGMVAWGSDHGFVAALIGGMGFRLYRIERSEALARAIPELVEQFWTDHVEPRIPPADCLPNLETFSGLNREPFREVKLADPPRGCWPIHDIEKLVAKFAEPGDALDLYQAASRIASLADKLRQDVQRTILSSMGDGELVVWPDGRAVTYRPVERRTTNLDRLARDHPDAYAACVTVKSSPRFNVKAAIGDEK